MLNQFMLRVNLKIVFRVAKNSEAFLFLEGIFLFFMIRENHFNVVFVTKTLAKKEKCGMTTKIQVMTFWIQCNYIFCNAEVAAAL